MKPRPVIHDCDPGLDDAVALLLLFGSPQEIELLGITTVAGNVPLKSCTDNALKICELAGRTEVHVYPGCSAPIMNPLVTATHVHGQSGLGGLTLPAPRMEPQAGHAVDFIIDTVKQRRDVTLCATGPLTNIAVALMKAPEIAGDIREIVLMGGAMARGNTTPAAEFNFFADPHAAQIVFGKQIPIVKFGLDLTHQVLSTPERVAAIRALGSKAAEATAEMLGSLPNDELERHGGCPLHDPCVMAYLIEPQMFDGKPCFVEIVTDSGPAQGQSLVDWWGVHGRPPNAQVMNEVNADRLFDLLRNRLN